MSYFVMYVKRRTWYPGPYVLAGDLGGDLCTSSGNDSLSHTFTFYFRPDNKITKINTNNTLYFAKPAKFLYLFAIIMTNLTIELPGIPWHVFYSSGKAQNKWRHYKGFPLSFFTGNRTNLSRRPDSRTPAWLRLGTWARNISCLLRFLCVVCKKVCRVQPEIRTAHWSSRDWSVNTWCRF